MRTESGAFKRTEFKRTRSLALVLLISLISLFPLVQTWTHRDGLLHDDILITLTYARNLGEGKGFTYNAPPATLGTTTPLWTFLCALGHFILPSVPLTRLAVLLSGFFWLAAIWTLFIFRRDLHLEPLALIASGAVLAGLGWPEALGMEAFLFIFLMLLSCGLFFRGCFFWSGLAASLLFLTRGEGILLWGVQLAALSLGLLFKKKRPDFPGGLRLLAGFSIPLVGWAAYALPTFHKIFPNSLGTKIAQARSGLWLSFWDRFWGEWLPSFKPEWHVASHWLNAWVVLVIAGLVIMARKRSPLCMPLAWAGLYFAGYSLLGVAAYSWYMYPIIWTTGMAAAQAAAALSGRLGKLRPRIFRSGWAGWLALLLFIAAAMLPAARKMKDFRPHPKCQTYLEVCRWLERNASPSQSIAYFEVGYLGFYTRNRVVDQMGLVTPVADGAIARRDFSTVFWLHRPDYILILNGSGFQYRIVSDPRFRAEYSPAKTFPGWGENPLILFRRRPG